MHQKEKIYIKKINDKVSEELKEVARLCMLRDFVSLVLTSDSCVTCKSKFE
jgi:hypothetical protein